MKKLLHFVNPVYNVNVLPSENGSVTASPISGTYGTEVTLTNTPAEGYVFDKYELTGATLYDGNKFKIKKSDVNVQGYFRVPSVLFYSGQSFSGTGNFTLPTIVNSQNLKYIAFYFNCKTNAQYSGGKAGSAMLDNNTTTTYYTQTTYSYASYSSTSVRLNFRGYYIDYNNGQSNTSYNEAIKIIVDTETLEGRFYRSGEYKTTKTMPYAPTAIARVRLTNVAGSLTNLAAAGFRSLEEAEAWDGSPF